mmetsp:Transcript_13674/g.42338  ORF Transcript_13674/g.42338 Transcript_13674/m.42338 type:complete len:238 (+) Transcript_13674:94-807(+)
MAAMCPISVFESSAFVTAKDLALITLARMSADAGDPTASFKVEMMSAKTSGHKLKSIFFSVWGLNVFKKRVHFSGSFRNVRHANSSSVADLGAFTFVSATRAFAAATAPAMRADESFFREGGVGAFFGGADGGVGGAGALLEDGGGGGGASTATTGALLFGGADVLRIGGADNGTLSSATTPFVLTLFVPFRSSTLRLVASRSAVAARSPGANCNSLSRSSSDPPRSPSARRATPRL